ncbi:hypothetical protein [Streptomyces sp. NPDC088725]|uniref:hypothetical protein n=1 Tax=Streptomyces sp. NPDC088725 TaxID=3365873 RepID=UPI0037FE6BC6
MSLTPNTPGSVRSPAAVNADIRALWTRAGGTLSLAEQERYHQLLVEWATAIQTEITAAAA